MASLVCEATERRHECRMAGGGPRYGAVAVLRPGQPVVLVNISSRAALVESGSRLRPGVRTELQMAGHDTRTRVTGHLDRCRVVGLDPLRYHGVIVFDERVDVETALIAKGSE
jgi:hypothetical protein